MNRILNFGQFVNEDSRYSFYETSINENTSFDISKDKVLERVHNMMYNIVMNLAYGLNQKEKENSSFGWVKYYIKNIWNPIDRITNPKNGYFKKTTTALDLLVEKCNNFNIENRLDSKTLSIEPKDFKVSSYLMGVNDNSSAFFNENEKKELENIKSTIRELQKMDNTFNMGLNTDEWKSLTNLPGFDSFKSIIAKRNSINNFSKNFGDVNQNTIRDAIMGYINTELITNIVTLFDEKVANDYSNMKVNVAKQIATTTTTTGNAITPQTQRRSTQRVSSPSQSQSQSGQNYAESFFK